MKKIYVLLISFAAIQTINAQKTDTIIKEIALEEVVISSSNFAEKKKNVAQKIDVISFKAIAEANAQNTGDLLQSTGKIFVQKSQQGGSSPVLRGFEASRVLLIIDGVRMNNAIYRSGHLQNAITTDQNSLSSLEVMYGPSSTIYGSDALGGAIHLITKKPILSTTKKTAVSGTGFARYSSVNDEKTIHADASIGSNKVAWYQSYSFSNFGDMKTGKNYSSSYPNFGKRDNYITQINGIDTVVKNNDNNVQKFSGYKQWDITQKLLVKQNSHVQHLLNLQLSNTNNVPRYDRLQDAKNFGGGIGTTLRYANWFYGPQKRLMSAYELSIVKAAFFDQLKATISYQNIEESRHTREYRRYDRFDSRVEKVSVLGATINAKKTKGLHEIVVGLDAQLNNVKSTASRLNLNTSVSTKLDTRYPDGKNRMNNFGVYAQHLYKFKNEKLVLNDGLRFQTIFLKSNINDNSFFKLPDTAFKQNNVAVTGNIGLIYTASKTTIVKTSISSGFRAPNIDDLAKVFESNTAARQVVLPNANIKPEYTYNIDLSVTQKIGKTITLDATGFYTLFRNAIVKAPYKINGQDSIFYDGVKSQVLASQNANKANVYGFSLGAIVQISNKLTITSTLSYTKGYFKTDNNTNSSVYEKQSNGTYALVSKKVSTKPLDHIPPVIGKTSVDYKYKKISTSFNLQYNGWKHLDDYNADGEDNAQYATADGMPSWITANFKANLSLTKNIQLQTAVENIFDKNYRNFASGFSAPGINFIIALRATL